MWIAKVMLFSSNYQSILAQFSRRKMPDNGLYTKYINLASIIVLFYLI